MPLQSWNEHTLAVTGIMCGSGTAVNARVYTSSLDHTVKVSPLAHHLIIGLGRMYAIFVNYNNIPEPCQCLHHRSGRKSHLRCHLSISNTPIQSNTVQWRKARSRRRRPISPVDRRILTIRFPRPCCANNSHKPQLRWQSSRQWGSIW